MKAGNCATQTVASNNFENGFVIGGQTNQRVANDITVGSVGYNIYGVELNILITGSSSELNFNFKILDGNYGLPWFDVAERGGTVASKQFLGTDDEGFDIYRYKVNFDSPLALQANNRYWLEVETNGGAWEFSTASALNAPLAFANSTTGGMWTFYQGSEGVFSLICDDPSLGTVTTNATDFTYYPNPVKNVLNFKSSNALSAI